MAVAQVHPRVGGEQYSDCNPSPRLAGSSPRGRGTVGPRLLKFEFVRFIPAWAGNSIRLSIDCSHVAVHPRVGGEQHPY